MSMLATAMDAAWVGAIQAGEENETASYDMAGFRSGLLTTCKGASRLAEESNASFRAAGKDVEDAWAGEEQCTFTPETPCRSGQDGLSLLICGVNKCRTPDRAAKEEETLEVTILNLSGAQLAILSCLPMELVSELKRRLFRVIGTAPSEQRLIHKHAILKDQDTLADCGIRRGGATLHCIVIRPSAVARNLESQRHCEDPTQALLASLADVSDSVMQSEYELSEKVRPRAEDVLRFITAKHRRELINWMVQAFELLHFDDFMLHSVVLTLDRYFASRDSAMEVTGFQNIVLSVVCTEMKLASETEFPRSHRHQVLARLGHRRVELSTILRWEFEVLSRLNFVVGVPTPVTFLRELAVHLKELVSTTDMSDAEKSTFCSQAVQLALFLLELSLSQTKLQYQRPHALLATAALGAALQTLGAPAEHREAIHEDLAAYCPGAGPCEREVLEIEEQLLQLWADCASGQGPCSDCYAQLEAKFNCPARQRVASLCAKGGLARLSALQKLGSDGKDVCSS